MMKKNENIQKRKLIIVSNRLPVSLRNEEDNISIIPSSGGLVSALTGFLNSRKIRRDHQLKEIIWIGSTDADEKTWKHSARSLNEETFRYSPVFIEEKIQNLVYHGFSNSTLLPL